jgi:kynureninase
LSQKTYLASHSLGAVPEATATALAEYYQQWATEGILAWDGPWWEAVRNFGASIEGILHAAEETVVPMQNVTRAMAAVASCFDFSGPRKRIVLTALEFTTSYPFWRSCERMGAEVVVVPSDDGVSVPTERVIAAIDERTLLAPLSHVYFRSGAVQDLGAICAAAHQKGAMVLGDGYQAVGTLPVDVTALDIDFYVGGCHKWLCGGAGAGYLYVRPDHIRSLRPRLTGWFGLQNPFEYEPGTALPEPADGILRFLGGTPNVPGLYAAREGLAMIAEAGVQPIRQVSRSLTAWIIEQCDAMGLTIRTPRDAAQRSGMVCLDFSGAEAVSEQLISEGIIVDWRPDCGIRLSPHFYNTVEDLREFFDALERFRRLST